MWKSLTFLLGAVAAVGLVVLGLQAIEPLHDHLFVRAGLGLAIVLLGAAIPTWLVGRLHPSLPRAYLLAYFASLLMLFVVIALLNMQVEL